MKPDQWFTLWMTVIQALVGGAATLAAVWIGAALALRGQRRSVDEARSRLAAERCLAAVDEATEGARRLIGEREVMKRFGAHAGDALRSRMISSVVDIHDQLPDSDISHEAWLLGDRGLVEKIAGCVDRLVRLHVKSFELSTEQIEQRLRLLRQELAAVGDQLRAIMLRKSVDELTPRDRQITRLLLRPSHSQLQRRREEARPSAGTPIEGKPPPRDKGIAAKWSADLRSRLLRLWHSRPQGRP
jgi:hypothetical protein